MMLPTHAIAGATLALPLLAIAPEYAVLGALAGLLGGAVPDFDLYRGHRRTLHFPVYYSLGALGAVAVALAFPGTVTIALAVFLAAAALHSATDVFGGGLELRPWENSSQRAVYNHYTGTWVPPRRWVRYDGAPEDLFVATVLAVPLILAHVGIVRLLVVGLLAVATIYATVRRYLPALAEEIVGRLPRALYPYLPTRYVTAVTAGSS